LPAKHRLLWEKRNSMKPRGIILTGLGLGAFALAAVVLVPVGMEEWHISRLGSTDRDVRVRSMERLVKLNPRRATKILVDRLPDNFGTGAKAEANEEEAEVMERHASLCAPELSQLTNNKRLPSATRRRAAAMLALSGRSGFAALKPLTESSDPQVRGYSVSALGLFGARARLLKPFCGVGSVEDDRSRAFREAGLLESEATAMLLNALDDQEWIVRYSATGCFQHLGWIPDETFAKLLTLIDDSRPEVRSRVLSLLVRGSNTRGPRRTEVLAALLRRLGDRDESVILSAIDTVPTAFPYFNPQGDDWLLPDEAILAKLRQLARDPRPEVQARALEARKDVRKYKAAIRRWR
jgi:HEAT repeat protein